MKRADFIARIKAGLPGSYKRFEDVLRDRRLNVADRIDVLGAWPAHDDFERANLARAVQALREAQDEERLKLERYHGDIDGDGELT